MAGSSCGAGVNFWKNRLDLSFDTSRTMKRQHSRCVGASVNSDIVGTDRLDDTRLRRVDYFSVLLETYAKKVV